MLEPRCVCMFQQKTNTSHTDGYEMCRDCLHKRNHSHQRVLRSPLENKNSNSNCFYCQHDHKNGSTVVNNGCSNNGTTKQHIGEYGSSSEARNLCSKQHIKVKQTSFSIIFVWFCLIKVSLQSYQIPRTKTTLYSHLNTRNSSSDAHRNDMLGNLEIDIHCQSCQQEGWIRQGTGEESTVIEISLQIMKKFLLC